MGFQKANENGLHGFGKLVVWLWSSFESFLKGFERTVNNHTPNMVPLGGWEDPAPTFVTHFFENTNVIKITISLTYQPPLFQAPPPHNLLGGAVPVQNNAINNVSRLLEAQGFQAVRTMKFTFFYKKLWPAPSTKSFLMWRKILALWY